MPMSQSLATTELDLTTVARRVCTIARLLEEREVYANADVITTTLGVWRDLTGLDHQASLNLAQVIVDASDAADGAKVRGVVVPF